MEGFHNWSYRGEGSHNLVIAHRKECIIYRLLKRKTFSNYSYYVNKQDSDATLRLRLENTVAFITRVIRPVLGSFTPQVDVVDLPISLLDEIKASIKYKYPGSEQLHPVALRMPDLCYLPNSTLSDRPTFCFEIKPNVLIIPTGSSPNGELPIKQHFCRHCFTQIGKKRTGVWPSICQSCPLDFVSGDLEVIKTALKKLMDTPQNRLRVFMDGELIYNKHCADEEALIKQLTPFFGDSAHSDERVLYNALDVIAQALLHTDSKDTYSTSHSKGNGSHSPEENRAQHPSFIGNVVNSQTYTCSVLHHKNETVNKLPKGCVLDKVRQMQKFGMSDVEGVFPYYSRILQHGPIPPLNDYEDSDWAAIANGEIALSDDGSVDFAVRKIKEFLVYFTMKACSIMITLQPVNQQHPVSESSFPMLEDPDGHRFQMNIKVLDLDPKPAAKIPTSLEVNRKYLNLVLEEFSIRNDEELIEAQL